MNDKQNSISNILKIAILCVLGILVYSNTFHSPFQFDDEENITENVSIRNLRDLKAIWSYWPTRFITYLSFAFNYHFNQQGVPGYHLGNLIIHLISAILVMWFILLTFSTPAIKDKEVSKYAKSIAFFGSLLFVCHPIQTQAVTYIYQRTASLAVLFYLASLSLYIKARLLQNQSSHSVIPGVCYAGSLIFALLGMFTKELVITLPLMILLYEFCFLRAGKNINWKYVVPFLVILLIIPVTMLGSRSARSGVMKELAKGSGEISRSHYFLTQFRVLLTYLRLLFVPLNQNLDYDYPVSETLWEMSTLGSVSVLLFILGTGILLFRRYRLISFCIFWFFLTLSVESSVIPLMNVIFEHRLYLPMVSYSIFLPAMLYYLCRKIITNYELRITNSDKSIFNKARLWQVILLMIVTLYSILAYARNEVWKSELSLWDDTVNKSPGKARPYNNRGVVYSNMGEHDKALSDFEQALSINPNYENAYNNRGVAYVNLGEFDKAMSDFNQALRIDSSHADAYNNRGNAYLRKGKFNKAVSDFNQSLRVNSDNASVYYNRGIAYENTGKYDKAISDFNKALSIDQNYADAYNNRGIAYLKKGEFDKAISDFNKALSINHDYADAYSNRGVAYGNLGEHDKAISDFNKALSINPNHVDACSNRRVACEQKRGN